MDRPPTTGLRMRRLALLALVAILAAACGSTSKDVTEGAGEAAEAVSGSASPGETPEAVASLAPGTSGGAGSAQPGGGGASGVVPGSKGGKSATGLPLGTGTIKIGFHYSENLDTAYRALGASGSFVNMVSAIESMVRYVNAKGGLGGKKVEPVFHGTDPLVGTFPAQAEAACTHFAQDEKVFAVVSGAVLPDINTAACHAKYRTPLVWSYQYLLDRKTLDGYQDYLYMPHAIAIERYGFYIDSLWESRFLTKSSKIGVFRYDDEQHERFFNTVIKPGLAKYGLVAIDKPMKRPHSAGEAGDVATQASNAMIDLRAKGVEHLLFVPSGGALPLIVGNVANSQNYYPKMAFTSFDIPSFVSDNLSDEQLAGAVALGWMPTNDNYLEQTPKSEALERCFAATGVRHGSVVRFCDGLFFLKDSLDRTPLFDAPGLKRAAYALGSWTRTPWSFGSKIGPNRHDGATAYRLMRFAADCSCFRYTGSNRPVDR